ncbi:MAG: hypothetical protein ACT4TC_25490 [Myxococcaceae bacterium]
MSSPRNRQDAEALRAKAKVHDHHVIVLEADWAALTPEAAAKLAVGVTIGRRGQPTYAKHLDGVALPVSVALPAPPESLIRDVATKLMNERAAKRQEYTAVMEIETRLREGGPSAVTLDELTRAVSYRHGPERVAEIKARVAAAEAQSNPTTEEIQS